MEDNTLTPTQFKEGSDSGKSQQQREKRKNCQKTTIKMA